MLFKVSSIGLLSEWSKGCKRNRKALIDGNPGMLDP